MNSPDSFTDLFGDSVAALDIPLRITEFPNVGASRKFERSLTLREVAAEIPTREAADRLKLPLLKLATYGDKRSGKGALRHSDNVLTVAGVEGDYDGGQITPLEAVERLRQHNLAGVVYTTGRHTPAAPRWRVLAPFSRELPAVDRASYAARLHGIFGGQLEEGSTFDLSKAFFFGQVRGRTPVEVHLVEGRPIDEASDLAVLALPRSRDLSQQAADAAGPIEPPNWPRIREALAVIPPYTEQGDSYGEWLTVAQALHHVSGGSDQGMAVFIEWSEGWEGFKERECRQKWRSFREARRGPRVTIASLFKIAQGYGYEPHLDLSEAELEEWIADLPDLTANDDETPASSRLRFLSPSDCESAPSRGYLIKSILAPGDLGCIFGAPGAGKSLLAPHLGYAVARGVAAFTMRTKPGLVFYCAAEDPGGMRGRIKALRAAHGDAPLFELVEGVSDLLAKDSPDLKELRRAIRSRDPIMVIIDTLAMAFPGLEENSAEAMGRVVAVGRKLADRGAAVLMVHHDPKGEGMTPRGHSLFNGALDVAIHVKRDESGVVRATLTKNRNGSCDRDIAFRIDTRTLGDDEDGDEITAALVKELPPGAAPKREKRSPATVALNILRRLAENGGMGGDPDGWVSEEEWREACLINRGVNGSENLESRKRALRRVTEKLTQDGRIEFRDGKMREVTDELLADELDEVLD